MYIGRKLGSTASPLVRLAPLLCGLTIVVACKSETNVGDTAAPETTWELVASTDGDAIAGVDEPVTVTLVGSDGTEEVVFQWTATSALEPALQRSLDGVVPVVAGTQELEITAEVDGETWTASTTLEVAPGPAARVDLRLSDRQVRVGQDIETEVLAEDAFGNPLDPSSVTVVADPGVIITPGGLSSDTVGTYRASATLDDLVDTELFVVIGGEPAAIALNFDTAVEQYDTVAATAVVTDTDGNVLPNARWSLTAVGDGPTSVSGRNVTFRGEGLHTVTATVDGTAVSDSVGPFLIDSTGPVLEILEPERGSRIEGTTALVRGTVSDVWSDVAELLVDGAVVPVQSDGTWEVERTWTRGLDQVEVEAWDTDDNVTTAARAAIVGQVRDRGEPIDDGALVRVHEGAGGFDTIETIGEDLIRAQDLDDLIPSPVFSDRSRSCTWLGCITWYSVALYVRNPSLGSVDLNIDPRSSGVLRTTLKVNDIKLDWSASGRVTGISYSGSGDVRARSMTVAMDLAPYVSSGDIRVPVSNVSVSSDGFDFRFNGFGWLEDVLDFFGYDVDNEIRKLVEGSLRDAVRDEVPSALEDVLADLELATGFDLLGTTTDVAATPQRIDIDNRGMTLALRTTAEPREWLSAWPDSGAYGASYDAPSWSGSPGMLVGLDLDFVNQVLYAVYGGGVLERELTASDVGLDVSDLRALFPDLVDLTITTEAALPPTVTPDGSDLQLALGGLHVTLLDGDAETGTPLIEAWVTVRAGLSMRSNRDGDALIATLGEPFLIADVVFPASNTRAAASTEALLEAIVPYVLAPLEDALGEIPIPAFDGFTLTGVTVSQQGAQGGYTTLGGSLSD